MQKIELTTKVEAAVKKFTAELRGFYRSDCGDNLLAALIIGVLDRPSKEYASTSLTIGESLILESNYNEAYTELCWLFETVLEQGCQAGGNGHHMAQRVIQLITEQR